MPFPIVLFIERKTEGIISVNNIFLWGENNLHNDAESKREFGTEDYIRYVLDRYSNTIVKLSYTYVQNICDAEDIAQDVLLALMRRGKPFESDDYEKAWILRTTINKSKNHLKSGWVKRTVSFTEAEENNLKSADELNADEENQVMEAVLSLPEKYRTPIHLFYYDGYSINEIAAIIGKSLQR